MPPLEASFLERDALLAALTALPHWQRAVIVLRYLSELTEAETATVLEISVGTVKSEALDALAHRAELQRVAGGRAGPSAGTDTTTEKWLPATAGNIANSQLAQIPADYPQVSQTELEKANPAGR
ncbi:MAG TPA: sigma factor-like helix-turn-helix DNA-binding protein [Solirubrobacteraceae bacterium]|jgi:hypothetical protein|nr:sigma factor-like helix-turn-helix DNA-binding protein [Solirubrobacteraceae bacterium]